MRILAFLSAVMLICAGVVFADYHYASHEGSDEYPYTSWETAADSIQNAIDAASPGDTVYVGAGTFVENLQMGDTLALIGMGWENTKIHGTEIIVGGGLESILNAVWIEGENDQSDIGVYLAGPSGEYMVVDACKITNCAKGIHLWAGGTYRNNILSGNDYGFDLLGYYPVIENNTIIDNDHHGISGSSNPIIRNNFIARNGTRAINIEYPYRVEMYNNIFYDNDLATNGVQVFFGFNSGPRYIYNNYFGMSEVRRTCLLLYDGYGIDSVENNIFSHGLKGILLDNSNACIFYNAFYDNDTNICLWQISEDSLVGNIFDNPMVTPEGDGFRLQAYSPCIDAGHPDIFDVDGTRSDIGAYGGPFGISYSYQDYPPEPPESLWARVAEVDTIIVEWLRATEADFNRYNIYRDTLQGFTPSSENMLASSTDSFYYDYNWDYQHNYYYLLTSIDNQGLESVPSLESAVILTSVFDADEPLFPTKIELNQNYPNPFNPETTINYHIPNVGAQPAEIRLEIYNVRGEIVRTLIDDRRYFGYYTVKWDGTDDQGTELSSGIYFYNVKFWGIAIGPAKKMALIR